MKWGRAVWNKLVRAGNGQAESGSHKRCGHLGGGKTVFRKEEWAFQRIGVRYDSL